MPDDSLLVHLLQSPIRTLGPGSRVGLWLQGCRRRCRGCMAPKTWGFEEERAVPLLQLLHSILSFWENEGDIDHRLTLSGGEPIDQSEPLRTLLTELRAHSPSCDILLYTGYRIAEVRSDHPQLLPLLTAVVDSPFEEGNPTTAVWKGSQNQNLSVLDPCYSERYQEWAEGEKKTLQLVRGQSGEYHLVGIPRQKDVPWLLKRLKEPL